MIFYRVRNIKQKFRSTLGAEYFYRISFKLRIFKTIFICFRYPNILGVKAADNAKNKNYL